MGQEGFERATVEAVQQLLKDNRLAKGIRISQVSNIGTFTDARCW